MSSLSSSLISSITTFRNPNGPEQTWARIPIEQRRAPNRWKVLMAEVAYLGVFVLAIAETALTSIAYLFALIGQSSLQDRSEIGRRIRSSGFSILWGFGDTILNFFCNDLITMERIARDSASSGNFLAVRQAVL